MSEKQRLIASLLLLLALSLAACAPGVRVGEMLARTQVVEQDGADAVQVDIEMGAGTLLVSGGANELLAASFTYNVAAMEPRATYADGKLDVRDRGVTVRLATLAGSGDYRNEWDLRLSDEVPLEMAANLGAGRTDLDLGGLALTRLEVNGGAGEVNLDLSGSQTLRELTVSAGAGPATIDLTGDWDTDLQAHITGGLGALTLRLPAGEGVLVHASAGIGAVETSGLTKVGEIYTNGVYGVSDATLRVDVDAGAGPVRLEVE